MILKDKDSIKILIECDCGCSGIELLSFDWSIDGKREYFIYHMIHTFSAEQATSFGKFKRKLKIIWQIITSGFYRYNEICLTAEQFKELKEEIIKFE